MILTLAAVAARLSLSERTVRRLVAAGALPVVQLSPRRVGIPGAHHPAGILMGYCPGRYVAQRGSGLYAGSPLTNSSAAAFQFPPCLSTRY